MPREFLVLFIENMKGPFLTCTFESALILFIVGSAPPLGLHCKLDRPRMPFSARYLLLAHIKLKAFELGLGQQGKTNTLPSLYHRITCRIVQVYLASNHRAVQS